jgi:hypothetical protein
MPKDEHLKALNLPDDATFEQLTIRYNQVSEILDPDLISNPILAQIALDAQKQIDHAHAYLEKTIPKPAKETTKKQPDKPPETPPEKPPETPPVTLPPTLADTVGTELKRRWTNLTCSDPAPFTHDWWDLNKTTVNALLCILIVLMAFFSSITHATGNAVSAITSQAQGAVAQIQSFIASIKIPTWQTPPIVSDDSLDIQIQGLNSSPDKLDPRPINLRQAKKFLFDYYSLLRQSHADIAYKAWTNEYQLTHNLNDFGIYNATTAKFLPSDYSQLPDDSVALTTSTPDMAKITYQKKWFTAQPGNDQISLVYTPAGWRIDSQTSVSQRAPSQKPSDFVRNYLQLIMYGNLTGAYDCLDPTYQQQHSNSDWSKSLNSMSLTKEKIDNANFTDTYLPPDSSPDSAIVAEGNTLAQTLFPHVKTFTDTYTLINNDGAWKIFDITSPPPMFNIPPTYNNPLQNPPYTPPYTPPQNLPPYTPPYMQPPQNPPQNPPYSPLYQNQQLFPKRTNPFAPAQNPNSK